MDILVSHLIILMSFGDSEQRMGEQSKSSQTAEALRAAYVYLSYNFRYALLLSPGIYQHNSTDSLSSWPM